MDAFFWIKVILFIIELIFKGVPKAVTVKMASEKFGVSEASIWNRGGF